MGADQNYNEIANYIQGSKYSLLTYLRSDLAPISRAMGSFAPDGVDLYFSTGKESAKVQELEKNRRVSFYFAHDNQSPESWKSVLLIGDVEPVQTGSENYDIALERLSAKSPRFRERIANGDIDGALIYKLVVREIEYLDRSKGYGPARKIVVKQGKK